MSSRRYFEGEMRYLHEAGKAFAEAHPEEARYLNADSVADRDPYVERLFEGFAFLTGRIRERLDDEFPQYTEALLSLLYPHVLLPVPACTIIEFEPKPGMVQSTTVLPPGTEVRSGAVGAEDAVCRFQTTAPVRLQPIQLTGAELAWCDDGTSSLRLEIESERGVTLNALDLFPLRLYLHAEPPVAAAAHRFLTRHVQTATVSVEGTTVITRPGVRAVRPVGFGDEEALLPYSDRSFSGFRLLHEYLSFRRKFLAVDLLPPLLENEQGSVPLALPERASTLTIELQFDQSFPEDRRFGAEALRLHCAPAINLFTLDAEPIRTEGYEAEYRVLPSARFRESYEVFDVLEVTGTEDETGARHTYRPFYEFNEKKAERHYATSRDDGGRVVLTLGGAPNVGGVERPETLSLAVRCTNGNLPREELREGMINALGPDEPQVARVRNLTQPTAILRPPSRRRDGFFWEMISHWSVGFQSVANRDALLGVLSLYDWTEDAANRRRLDGLVDVAWHPKELVHRGAVVRGSEVVLTVDDAAFAHEGELALFGLVLSRFFALYATFNSFVHLTIETRPSERRYTWTPSRGERPVV